MTTYKTIRGLDPAECGAASGGAARQAWRNESVKNTAPSACTSFRMSKTVSTTHAVTTRRQSVVESGVCDAPQFVPSCRVSSCRLASRQGCWGIEDREESSGETHDCTLGR